MLCCAALVVQLGLQMRSERDDQDISSASIAENPMLGVVNQDLTCPFDKSFD